MRKLLTTTFLTLDGVMQAPGGPEEDDSGAFKYGGWSVPNWDDDVAAFMSDTMGIRFDLLLGRRTYDIFAGFWPNAPMDETSRPLNEATKYVASRGRPNLTWQKSVLLEGDVARAVADLKKSDGPELQVHGSGNLIQTLLRNNLIDEMRLLIYPVLLGPGKRLFAEGTIPAGLKLLDSRLSGSGVFVGKYVPAGEVVTGSFAN